MRWVLRGAGIFLAIGGSLVLLWVLAVWRWQDPLTLVVNKRAQSELSSAYAVRVEREQPLLRPAIRTPRARPAVETPSQFERAGAYRKRTEASDPIGRLTVPRLNLEIMVVYGTDRETLKKGPGLHPTTGFPGQRFLTYVAGHRTTYGAPFSDIDKLRPGDKITFEVPYGTYRYEVVGHQIVRDDQIEVLKGRGREELALQACWPRFFATHRYIAYAKLVGVDPVTPRAG
ncbi:MAG: class D sortase [Actinomycetota bacterium]|nr:class D sortase [Actinomycetota bacterium]